MSIPPEPPLTYEDAGVDVAGADRFVGRVDRLAASTHTAGVVQHASRFAGLFRPDLAGLEDPLIAATCDGVGTKLLVARDVGSFEGLGRDLVAMNVNDLLPLGARPLLFLDYIATGKLDPEPLEAVLRGVSTACRDAGCALLGGETAEMPGLYRPGDFDLAGFTVGLVDGARLPDPGSISAGDALLALPSTGLHSNGFSLARRALLDRAALDLTKPVPELGRPLGEELLEPTAIYVEPVLELGGRLTVKAAAHVTGGGLLGRAGKLVREGLRLEIDPESFPRHPIFDLVQECGSISEQEMASTFNMGLGYLVVVSEADAERVLAEGAPGWLRVGRVVAGEKGVDLGDCCSS